MVCLKHLFLQIFSLNGILALIGLFLLTLILLALFLHLTNSPYPSIKIHRDERYFIEPILGERHPLPQLGTIFLSNKDRVSYQDIQPSSLYLSVIVPAYNEEKRLPKMLDEAFEFLEKQKYKYEIIIVDDGSKDRTTEIGWSYVEKYGINKIRVITLVQNRGKGGAVRIGMLAAQGELCLFADADGATKFCYLDKLLNFVNDHRQSFTKAELYSLDKNFGKGFDPKMFPIAIGSRAHLEKESIAQRSIFRTILMKGFHFVVWILTVKSVRDTQCGFKLFPRTIAHILFTHTHIERWAFDVELLLLAEKLKVPIGEIPVEWTEIEGSKIVPVFSWLQMGFDVFMIFFNYAIGSYQYPKAPFDKIHGLKSEKTKAT